MAYDKGLVSFRVRHPTDGEIEVTIGDSHLDVDAVFTSVDAVKKFLMPTYKEKEAKDLLNRVEKQQNGGNCIVLHKYPCGNIVPNVNWKDHSIRI
jgi:hypothetical protein